MKKKKQRHSHITARPAHGQHQSQWYCFIYWKTQDFKHTCMFLPNSPTAGAVNCPFCVVQCKGPIQKWPFYKRLYVKKSVVVCTPRPSCSEIIFDHIFVFTVQFGWTKLVSDSGMVQWLGRYKGELVWLEKGTLPNNTGK